MSELQDKFKQIISNIEERIQDKEELEFIKEQIATISVLFLDQLDKVVDLSTSRLDEVVENQRKLNEKVMQVEKVMGNIEKDIYLDDNYDFEIVCPYCNHEFTSDFSAEVKEEVECPECHNIIELDWNQEEEEGCSGHCGCCDEECGQDDEQENKEKNSNSDDDDM